MTTLWQKVQTDFGHLAEARWFKVPLRVRVALLMKPVIAVSQFAVACSYSARVYIPPYYRMSSYVRAIRRLLGILWGTIVLSESSLLLLAVLKWTSQAIKKMRRLRHFYSNWRLYYNVVMYYAYLLSR
jgi:hypothetical protein